MSSLSLLSSSFLLLDTHSPSCSSLPLPTSARYSHQEDELTLIRNFRTAERNEKTSTLSLHRNDRYLSSTSSTLEKNFTRSSMRKGTSSETGTLFDSISSRISSADYSSFLFVSISDAQQSIRRKQDKEREAAGLGPPTRGGASNRGQPAGRGGASNRGGGAVARQNASKQAANVARRGGGMGGGMSRNNQTKDANLWIHLVGLLKKKELLPVVAFVFSKKRCEEYAASMPNTDLCTAAEKSEVHIAIERSLTRLKGTSSLPLLISI